jgi:hypothetical protein
MGQSRIHYPQFTATSDYLPANATGVHVRVYSEDCGDPWSWSVDAVDDHGNYSEGVDRFATWREAMDFAPTVFEEYVRTRDRITRDNQQPDVIYSGDLYGSRTVFVSPDGVGRFYFDTIRQAREDMGEDLPVRHVLTIED